MKDGYEKALLTQRADIAEKYIGKIIRHIGTTHPKTLPFLEEQISLMQMDAELGLEILDIKFKRKKTAAKTKK